MNQNKLLLPETFGRGGRLTEKGIAEIFTNRQFLSKCPVCQGDEFVDKGNHLYIVIS